MVGALAARAGAATGGPRGAHGDWRWRLAAPRRRRCAAAAGRRARTSATIPHRRRPRAAAASRAPPRPRQPCAAQTRGRTAGAARPRRARSRARSQTAPPAATTGVAAMPDQRHGGHGPRHAMQFHGKRGIWRSGARARARVVVHGVDTSAIRSSKRKSSALWRAKLRSAPHACEPASRCWPRVIAAMSSPTLPLAPCATCGATASLVCASCLKTHCAACSHTAACAGAVAAPHPRRAATHHPCHRGVACAARQRIGVQVRHSIPAAVDDVFSARSVYRLVYIDS